MSILNNIVNELDIALRTISNKKSGTDRQYPPDPKEKNSEELSKKEKDLSIQMMRINHAGEVAAQALYRGQAFVCKDPKIKEHLIQALKDASSAEIIVGAFFSCIECNWIYGRCERCHKDPQDI